ncbi:lytic murein transglycosylase [Ramlibacter sp. PS3R-8]|uniref:lytic murein transglycosylase n=1 Tax=Ramlibacter sp. PS3R-8 TaxID=3133437 RepID=UPI00309B5159
MAPLFSRRSAAVFAVALCVTQVFAQAQAPAPAPPASASTAAASAPTAASSAPTAAASANPLIAQAMAPEQFAACVQQLGEVTGSAGRPLAREDFLRITASARYDDRVRQSLLVQAGEPTFWWDELAATTDDDRVREGQRVLAANTATLQRVETQFGIPREVIVAIYGIETNYGPAQGRIPVLDSTLTLACLRPCPPERTTACLSRERAYAAVRLVRDRKVRPENWQGSWAGAFGRTQFVPDSFEQLGVDFDGDGVSDIINSEPDSWATTANHLKTRGGWLAGVPPYLEVTIPKEQQAAFAATGKSIRLQAQARKLSEWVAMGWTGFAPNGQAAPLQAPGDPELYPFLPVGLPGPAFLVSRNFNTIYRYNNSERYVMEVALLATRLAGGSGFVTPWPTDDPGLSRAQVRELQAWLVQRGHTLVRADGVMGRNTRDAIAAELVAKGLPPARRAGQRTMQLLMSP